MESLEDVWSYCTANNRLVPMPQHWSRFCEILKRNSPATADGKSLLSPFILAAWHETMPMDKQLRFKEQLKWAHANDALTESSVFLKGLSESQWCHFGEI
jgi:hypothetical protein